MKVRIVLSFLAALFIVGNLSVNAANAIARDRFHGLDIVLKGEVGTETGRSAIPSIPIDAVLGDDGLVHIAFDAPLGTVEVSIDGQVLETCEVTTVGQETAFSVIGWEPGAYVLELKTPKGGYVYGEFVIE